MTAAIIGTNLGYILLSFLPPILWLLFYLREDEHAEPKILLTIAFIGGMAAALLALAGECVWVAVATGSCRAGLDGSVNPLIIFGGIALIEEFVKFLPVRLFIIKRPAFDEPIDAMIYMMTSAMGFAALENLLFLFPIFHENVFTGLEITTNRFLGANLLHALASGIVGFFLARAFFSHYRHHFVALGILLAAILHTAFNYLILTREVLSQSTFYLILLLSTMAVMVLVDFERLKKRMARAQNNKTDLPPIDPAI